MKRGAEVAILAAAAALLGATATVTHRRQRQRETSPWPVTDNPGPHGIAALHAWLLETGRRPLRLESPDDRPPPAATVVLAAPAAALEAGDAAALMAHAERGGLVVWAVGPEGSQPELERRLAVSRSAESTAEAALPGEADLPLAPHPLFAGLTLRSGGGGVESRLPGALPVAGHRESEEGRLRAAAVSISAGRGEVLLLAGTSLLENFRIAEGDNLSLWARIAARGPVAFDERFREPRGKPSPPSARALAALVGQALAAAMVLFWARGRRLGTVRPPLPAHQGRTAADYLASLALLYRRARAEPELCRAAWDRFRRELARRGIPLRLPDEEVARRLARTNPAAAGAFRRASAVWSRAGGAGPGELHALSKAIAETEVSLRAGRRESTRSPRA